MRFEASESRRNHVMDFSSAHCWIGNLNPRQLLNLRIRSDLDVGRGLGGGSVIFISLGAGVQSTTMALMAVVLKQLGHLRLVALCQSSRRRRDAEHS
jgi:hypothetical protein